jgi:hypothetical protein
LKTVIEKRIHNETSWEALTIPDQCVQEQSLRMLFSIQWFNSHFLCVRIIIFLMIFWLSAGLNTKDKE